MRVIESEVWTALIVEADILVGLLKNHQSSLIKVFDHTTLVGLAQAVEPGGDVADAMRDYARIRKLVSAEEDGRE